MVIAAWPSLLIQLLIEALKNLFNLTILPLSFIPWTFLGERNTYIYKYML